MIRRMGRRESDASPIICVVNGCAASTPDIMRIVEPELPASSGPDGEPHRSRLGQILAERPEARPRLKSAVSSLIATTLVAFAASGILLIWHFKRRAQLLRDRLAPPRRITYPELEPTRGHVAPPHDPSPGQESE